MSITGSLTASFLSNMNAKSAHPHLVRSRHALRENGCHIDTSFRLRAVTEFLVKEGNSVGLIYERLRGVHGCQQCQKVGETF